MSNKKRIEALSKFDSNNFFTIEEAASIIKKITNVKFDATVDISIRLGVDPKQPNEMIRGVVSLPHGTGKELKIVVVCQANKEEEAKTAGADLVGYEDIIDKVKYKVPFYILGRLMHKIFIRRKLVNIFRYRQKIIHMKCQSHFQSQVLEFYRPFSHTFSRNLCLSFVLSKRTVFSKARGDDVFNNKDLKL